MELLQALRQRWWLVLGILLIVALALSTRLATFYTDVLWFRSVGFVRVFWTLLTTQFPGRLSAGSSGFEPTLSISWAWARLVLDSRSPPSMRAISATRVSPLTPTTSLWVRPSRISLLTTK
jgi:uncharacterized membrane protein (UPF0182 family)